MLRMAVITSRMRDEVMANIKILIKSGIDLDDENDIGIAHLPGSEILDHDTACGRTAEMRCKWEYGKGKVTCRACQYCCR